MLGALASLSFTATSNAGGRGHAPTGGGLGAGHLPRPVLVGTNTADGPTVISNGRGRGGSGGGRGGHDDPPGHH